MLRNTLHNALPKPEFRAKLLAGWQSTNDIVKAIQEQHKLNLPYAKKISKYFCAPTERETAKNIFNFLKNEIEYRVEPASKQTTKTLSRFIHDGFGDCKHFAIFSNTILESCGFHPVYRFAGYKNSTDFQHVYSYLPNSNTVLDAVLSTFDTEKTPTNKKDLNMSLYRLSGFEDENDEIGKISFDSIKKGIKTAAAKTSNVVKKAASSIPDAAKKLAQGAKTVSLAVPRNAFLGLVLLNVHGLATNLKKIYDSKGMDGLKFWYDFGGDRSKLIDSIKQGATKKKIFGIEEEQASYNEIFGGYSGDGIAVGDPVTISAALASATPILIKVADIFKKAGISADDVAKVSTAIKQGSQAFKEMTGKDVTDVIFKKDAGVTSNKVSITNSDLKPVDQATAEKVVTAAVATSTNVPMEVITELKNQKPVASALTFPTFNKKTVFIGVGVVVVLGAVLKSMSNQPTKRRR